MEREPRVLRREFAVRAAILASLCCLSVTQIHGCHAAGVVVETFWVRGKLLDADTLDAVAGAAIGGRTFTNGEETEFVPPFIFDGSAPVSSGADGTFTNSFSRLGYFGGWFIPGLPVREREVEVDFPRPDETEVIVVRGNCEYSFFIELNEDTVVDPTFPENEIELRDPILVPPCEE
jgi:hypothetical protein